MAGRGAGFSLEAPEGVRFLIRGRVFTEEENAALAQHPPRTGAQSDRTGAQSDFPGTPTRVPGAGAARGYRRKP